MSLGSSLGFAICKFGRVVAGGDVWSESERDGFFGLVVFEPIERGVSGVIGAVQMECL